MTLGRPLRGFLRRWRSLPDPGAPSETERDLSRYEALGGQRRRLARRLHEIRVAASGSRLHLEVLFWARWHRRARNRLAAVEAERAEIADRLGIAREDRANGGGHRR